MLVAELNHSRKLGVEYEMTVPRVGSGNCGDVQSSIQQVLSSNGLNAVARGYSQSPLPPGVDLGVEYDSSVQGQSQWNGVTWFPIEIKTRILNLAEWESIVPKTLQMCSYLGARVNHTTGHHVHLGFNEIKADPRNLRSVYNLFLRYEPVIFGLVSPSRRTMGYSRPLPFNPGLFQGCRSRSQFIQRINSSPLERRSGLNLIHVGGESPRIEFRYHHGSLNPEKTRFWLRFLMQMLQHAVTRSCHTPRKQIVNDRAGIEKLLVSCGFKPNSGIYQKVCPELRETGKWLLSRWKHFNGDKEHALRPRKKLAEGRA